MKKTVAGRRDASRRRVISLPMALSLRTSPLAPQVLYGKEVSNIACFYAWLKTFRESWLYADSMIEPAVFHHDLRDSLIAAASAVGKYGQSTDSQQRIDAYYR